MKKEVQSLSLYDILVAISEKRGLKIKGGGKTELLRFNLSEKSIISGGKKYLMKDGKIIPQTLEISDGSSFELTEDMPLLSQELSERPFFDEVEDLFKSYYTSQPSEISAYAKPNFVSKRFEDISFRDLLNGISREVARTKLEAYVMLSSLTKQLCLPNKQHFFWQSKQYPSLIIYRDWL